MSPSSLSSYEAPSSSPVPSISADFDPHTLPPHLSPLELRNLLETTNDVKELETLLSNHGDLYCQYAMFQSLDCTICCLEYIVQKTQEELHDLFHVMESEGIVEALAPLII